MLAVNILGTAATIFKTKADLQAPVKEYDANPTDAIATYGPIAGWDVSRITDMSDIFSGLQNFDADISSWDTSSVTSMGGMFGKASAFNQPLNFDMTSVTNMQNMFTVRSVPAPCLRGWLPPCAAARAETTTPTPSSPRGPPSP